MRLAKLLTYLKGQFNGYHQAMSGIGGLLLLFLGENDIPFIPIMQKLNYDVIPNYWHMKATGYNTDSMIFGHILLDRYHPLHLKYL